MTKQDIIKQVCKLVYKKCSTSENIEKGEKLFLNYLKDNEDDIEIWYKLALLELLVPLLDYERAIEYLYKIWLKSKDIKAIIYICIVQYMNSFIEEKYLQILTVECTHYKVSDPYIYSMICYTFGLFYLDNDNHTKAIDRFKETVEYNSSFTKAYRALGELYEKTNINESILFYKKAVESVESVYSLEQILNSALFSPKECLFLSKSHFEQETILGNEVSEVMYNDLLSKIN